MEDLSLTTVLMHSLPKRSHKFSNNLDSNKRTNNTKEMFADHLQMVYLDASIGEIKMVLTSKHQLKDKENVALVMLWLLFQFLKLESESNPIIKTNHSYQLVVLWDVQDTIKDAMEDTPI